MACIAAAMRHQHEEGNANAGAKQHNGAKNVEEFYDQVEHDEPICRTIVAASRPISAAVPPHPASSRTANPANARRPASPRQRWKDAASRYPTSAAPDWRQPALGAARGRRHNRETASKPGTAPKL